MTGAQRRHAPGAFSVSPPITTTVTSALTGAAGTGLPAGTLDSKSPTAGSTVSEISMITVPETVGVRIRWNSASRQDSTSGTRAVMTTSVASSAAPPSVTAVMLTEMKAAEAPISSTWPPPNRLRRNACRMVVRPDTATVANTAQATYASLWPAARITTVGISMIAARLRAASCSPSPTASASGGRSSGW